VDIDSGQTGMPRDMKVSADAPRPDRISIAQDEILDPLLQSRDESEFSTF